MSILLWVLIGLYAWRVVSKIIYLGGAKYPRPVIQAEDAGGLVVGVVILITIMYAQKFWV